MNLVDIYSHHINESLDKPYPIHKRSATTYDIDADGIPVRVLLNGLQIDGVNVLSVKFINPTNTADALSATNTHGNAAIRVFATLVHLIDPIRFNLLICVADDTSVDVEQKKNNLYRVIMKKLERLGKIHSVRTISVVGFDKPIIVAERGVSLPDERIRELTALFAQARLSQ